MTLADEDTQALLDRRKVLDSTVMNLAMAGVAVPVEMEREFVAVQDELARRGERKPPDKVPDWTDWLGRDLGQYKIQYMVEEGLYWYLFHASGPHSDQVANAGSAAIKIAKEAARYGDESRTMRFATRLFSLSDDIVREVQPAQNALIDCEVRRLSGITSSALPAVAETSQAGDCRYYRLNSPAGESLAEKLLGLYARDDAPQVISFFGQVAAALDLFTADPAVVYHGNLKPENIIFAADGIVFSELGNYCPLLCSSGMEPEVRITTPQYYPWLDVDDIGALGICLWEALIGYHPFDDKKSGGSTCILSGGLRQLVDLETSLSNIFILPLLDLQRPEQLGIMTAPRLEQVLFKSIKIRLGEDGLLHEDPGYQSLSEFKNDLLALLNEPVLMH